LFCGSVQPDLRQAAAPNLIDKVDNPRLLARQVDDIDHLVDQRVDLPIKQGYACSGPRRHGNRLVSRASAR
jgi:hypothetical protein